MAKQTINIGAAPNDGTGTPLRTSFDYCNQNFTELYTATGPSGNNIVVPGSATITGDLTVATNTLKTTSGNVGIGTVTPDIFGRFYTRSIGFDSSGSTILQINGTSYGGVDLGAAGVRTFSMTSSATDANISTVTNIPMLFGINNTEAMRLNTTGNLVLKGGTANANGVGVTFPATQVASSDANTLDDYKEAAWSPVISAGSGTPTTVTVNSAVYTKIGRVVVCTFDFSIVNKGTASSSLQFGLPVTSITSTAFCGSFREDGSTGNMGMVIYSTGTTAACLLYNNATPWVDGYRLKGTYTYFAA